MNTLYISSNVLNESKSGISLGSKMHYDTIKKICNNLELFPVYPVKKNAVEVIENFLLYHRYSGMTKKIEDKIIKKVQDYNIDLVYIDTSQWGFLVERIKKETTSRVIVFCMDIEYFRMKSLCRVAVGQRNFKKFIENTLFFYLAQINEKKTVQFVDYILNYNKRDAILLERKYKRQSDQIIPLYIKDKKINFENYSDKIYESDKLKLLFVGVGEYLPNVEGLRFFISEVLPKIPAHLYIVGRGTEYLRDEFCTLSHNVSIIGFVNDLEPYYINADAVIIPLFSGGGMKIKTVEAMMYAKSIFGTSEAFMGYKVDYNKIGGLCNSRDEFIRSILNYKSVRFNKYSREVFLKRFSQNVCENRFFDFFNHIVN